jgi:uncharacterized protein YyaL (SSP411 family)/aryl-alcohol dehydrogenase-like predicted oxidoreductase
MSSAPRHSNRLADQTSPYLLQHAHNPVDWHPWGDEALQKARAENKPILLSIGYAACHWCHVMERESFEDVDTAALMNEHFVNIKVDREERPDIDEIYMAATVAMSGSGGWPMTVFLAPDQRPFFAGTYFPPRDMYGRPGFPTLLRRIATLWEEDRDTLLTQAATLTSELRARSKGASPRNVGQAAIDHAVDQLRATFDERWGGFSPAPKFPPVTALELLLRHHQRSGDEHALHMVRRTLDAMAEGGMRDHLGGGFARYSTDERWLVPHFEKMLYDNALLARAYAEAFQVTANPNDRRVACETLDYVLREMQDESGGFYSATDADSEGVEGKFFVWTPDEIHAVLPPEQATAFCAYYDVTPQGNWEGHSILHTPRAAADVAAELSLDIDELERRLAAGRTKLYAARKDRVPPLCDDKILTAWNALMIGSMAECGRIFDEPRYVEGARRAADFVLTTLRRPDGGLFRTTRAGKTHLDAYLEDYAYLCDALIDLYEASADARYLVEAVTLAERMLADFLDPEGGGFLHTAHGHEKLLVKSRDGQDGAIPSANAFAARALARLSWMVGNERYRTVAGDAVRAHGALVERAPRAFAASLLVVDLLLEGPVECVLVGAIDDPASVALRSELGRSFLPNRVIVHRPDPVAESAPFDAALTDGKEPVDGKPALYVCRNFACRAPVVRPGDVAAALADDRQRAAEGRGRLLGKRLEGRATAIGTKRYVQRQGPTLPAEAFGELPGLDLYAGRIAFGGYRVDDGSDLHRDALRKALGSGCNLVDTSTNYTDGASERLVGSVIAELVAADALRRDEVIVVSKIGYVQGGNMRLARDRDAAGQPFDEMVRYSDDCWHCMHPSFLDDQLGRSLERLGLDTLDVCLLHNPEYFLADAHKRREARVAARDAFYRRLEQAFRFLEQQVEAGRIGCYGVSSNTVAAEPGAFDATDLSRMLAAAEAAGGSEHHFRVLQLPLNLFESRAVLGGQGAQAGSAVLRRATEAKLTVLANRPLNAIVDEGMVRLAEPPAEAGDRSAAAGDFASACSEVEQFEQRFRDTFAGSLDTGSGGPAPDQSFVWAEQLRAIDGQLGDVSHFEQVARGQVIPHISRMLASIERVLPGSLRSEWSRWRGGYIRAVETALTALRAQAAASARERTAALRDQLAAVLPLSRHGEPLQRLALWTLASTPGLSVVLLGMRHPRYVDDALEVMAWSALEQPERVYEALAAAPASPRRETR